MMAGKPRGNTPAPAVLTALLDETHGNVTQAARAAGVDRVTFYRQLKRRGLQDERVRILKRLRQA